MLHAAASSTAAASARQANPIPKRHSMARLRAPSNLAQPIDGSGSPAEQRGLLGGAVLGRDALERVPQDAVVAGLLVGRKVAFEHAPRRAEHVDAGLDVRPP